MSDADEASPGLWQDGWLRGATHLPSPNFGPRPGGTQIDLIVPHSISLPPCRYGGDGAAAVHQSA